MSDLPLHEHYILYIDLLGYKAIMSERSEIDFLKVSDKSYCRAKQMIGTMSQETHSNSRFKYKVFSDNIVVATEAGSTEADSTHALYSLSFIAYLLQREFIKNGIMCRGALTKGQLSINSEYVFGSGLIRAVELEDTIAYYPRIIVDRLPEVGSIQKSTATYSFLRIMMGM